MKKSQLVENNEIPNELHYLKRLCRALGKQLRIAQLHQHHLPDWLAPNPLWGQLQK